MAPWQRLRLSLGLDRGLATENVCWRCALRQTRRHRSTLQGALSEGTELSQKTYDALARSSTEKRFHRKRVSQGLPIRKLRVDPFDPSNPSRLRIVRPGAVHPLPVVRKFLVNPLSMVKKHLLEKSRREAHIDLECRNRNHEQETSYFRIRGRVPEIVPSVRLITSDEDGNDMPIRSNGPDLEPDTVLEQVYAPGKGQDSEDFGAAANSPIDLDNVLNAFQNLRIRTAPNSLPIRKWPSPHRSDSTRSHSIRNYTTSTVGELESTQILMSMPTLYRLGMQVMKSQSSLHQGINLL